MGREQEKIGLMANALADKPEKLELAPGGTRWGRRRIRAAVWFPGGGGGGRENGRIEGVMRIVRLTNICVGTSVPSRDDMP